MKVQSIRFRFIRNFLIMALMGGLIYFVFLQFFLFKYGDQVLNTKNILVLTFFLLIVYFILSIYFGYRNGRVISKRLDEVLSFVSILRSGKYSARAIEIEKDEIGLIFEEMNQLAMFLQDQVRSLQRLADEKTELANQAHHAAVIEERQRLARDLHDSVSQQLFALGMISSAALRTVQSDPNQTKSMLEQIANISAKAQGEMRALLLHLRPIDLKGDTLNEGLNKLIDELKEKTNLDIECQLEHFDTPSKAIEDHIFRIVQEALSNILRHSQATKVRITLETIKDQIHLYISDNGKGFKVEKNLMTSYGLQTMRERCEELGGVFQIRSMEEEGTYINIRIPL
ncbi:sensor histidine kinase [Heyndrickxia oleronia]|uniref:sensor histidine kinase n=1 Tax=Heyndrickxia oleronia TaxID=38875 RepID=UPI0024305C69|nr:sensor histidine kinase [Heyndrickxia oleronia]MCI1592626.1 sensor histidine kinase [Heyndrickxia oleronia]MCI1613718.1 sensor histidine kinase [Heyndrickxia oleronia]MCI1744848.1 sensor histidine kinase [Heyndrickxia oleronia]MCI1761581.1 sensor histidine kinase [Heyndrickxia oleronia]